MISRHDFKRLRSGDVVLWCRRRFRTVIFGPADDPRQETSEHSSHWHVEFPISHRSWTGSVSTSYDYTAAKDKIEFTGLRLGGELALPEEFARLARSGFTGRDMLAELREEMERFERCKKWMPMNRACRRVTKLLLDAVK